VAALNVGPVEHDQVVDDVVVKVAPCPNINPMVGLFLAAAQVVAE